MEMKFSNYDNRVKWQIECDNILSNKNNVILASPTGTGKTGRYEYWALNKPERPIFITSPIKSLSNQKYRDFKSLGYKVGLETGDIKYIPDDDCDIICCTQEIYNNKYRDVENSTVIIDEFSYIFDDEERARAYIDSLYYSKAKNIMLCSATFGNPEEIKEYINKVTKRDFYLYSNDERLTNILYKGLISKANIKNSFVVAYSKKKCRHITELIYLERLEKRKKILSEFASSSNYFKKNQNEIQRLAKKYNIKNMDLIKFANYGVVFYYGALFPKEKLFVEELFENKIVDTIVGTDALALGVNFPIEKVVFTEFVKKHNYNFKRISKNLFEQLSGRAGRKGYFDEGYVFYCNEFSDNSKTNKKYFNELLKEKNENVEITLKANIKDILLGKSSIENEAKFITEYSTVNKIYDVELKKIEGIIDYIENYDIASEYINYNFPYVDFKDGYATALDSCSLEDRQAIEKLSQRLTLLQPFFDEDIGKVYLTEFSPRRNCKIFTDVLLNESIDNLIEKYGTTLYDLLLLRKYLYNLPFIYSKKYDLSVIDDKIKSLDHTILCPPEFEAKEKKSEKNQSKKRTNKKKKNNCPSYFDKILINGKEYIKLFNDGKNILICNDSGLKIELYKVPSNTKYKLMGLLKPTDGLKVIEKINLNSNTYVDDEMIDTLSDIKSSLIKKYNS